MKKDAKKIIITMCVASTISCGLVGVAFGAATQTASVAMTSNAAATLAVGGAAVRGPATGVAAAGAVQLTSTAATASMRPASNTSADNRNSNAYGDDLLAVDQGSVRMIRDDSNTNGVVLYIKDVPQYVTLAQGAPVSSMGMISNDEYFSKLAAFSNGKHDNADKPRLGVVFSTQSTSFGSSAPILLRVNSASYNHATREFVAHASLTSFGDMKAAAAFERQEGAADYKNAVFFVNESAGRHLLGLHDWNEVRSEFKTGRGFSGASFTLVPISLFVAK